MAAPPPPTARGQMFIDFMHFLATLMKFYPGGPLSEGYNLMATDQKSFHSIDKCNMTVQILMTAFVFGRALGVFLVWRQLEGLSCYLHVFHKKLNKFYQKSTLSAYFLERK